MSIQQKPAVSWWWDYMDMGTKKYDRVGLKNGVGVLDLWDIGAVRAGNEAVVDETIQTFYIWNNKSGSEKFQSMTNCELTVRDGNYTDGSYHEGNADSPPVVSRWFEARTFKSVKDGTGAETSSGWTPVGLNIDGSIAKINFEALGNGLKDSVDKFQSGEISGDINDGTFTGDVAKNNYAKVQLRMRVPMDADPGEINTIARIYYSSRVV